MSEINNNNLTYSMKDSNNKFMRINEIRRYCLKEYNVVLQNRTVKQLSKPIHKSEHEVYVNIEPIIGYCKRIKDCEDKGYIRVKELERKIKNEYNKTVSSERLYEISKNVIRISNYIVYIGDWEDVIKILSKDTQTLRKETCLKKYGTEYSTQSKEIKEKGLNTYKEKHKNQITVYGLMKIFNKDISGIKKIIKYLNIKSLECSTKRVKYYDYSVVEQIEKFYKEHPNTYEFFCKNTCMNKYGVENVSQLDEVKNKKKRTSLKNYGVEYYAQTEEGKKFYSKVNTENAEYRIELRNETVEQQILNFEKEHNCLSLAHANKLYNFGYNKCGRFSTIIHILELDYLEFQNNLFIYNKDIPQVIKYKELCRKHLTSFFENEVYDYIKSICEEEIVLNDRQVISPKELDIYIPNKNIAIECDGLYWHCNEIKENDYHLNKTIACEQKGIRLLHIFEDEWKSKKNICKSIISSALGIYQQEITADDCIISKIETDTANKFLKNNSIYEVADSDFNFGLFYDNKLIYVVSFKRADDNIQLMRECSKLNIKVENGLKKLILFSMKEMNCNEIMFEVDRRLFNEDYYKSCKFKKVSETEPNYFYIFANRRNKDISKLGKNYSFTEEETRRIYDSGTIRMKFKID